MEPRKINDILNSMNKEQLTVTMHFLEKMNEANAKLLVIENLIEESEYYLKMTMHYLDKALENEDFSKVKELRNILKIVMETKENLIKEE